MCFTPVAKYTPIPAAVDGGDRIQERIDGGIERQNEHSDPSGYLRWYTRTRQGRDSEQDDWYLQMADMCYDGFVYTFLTCINR